MSDGSLENFAKQSAMSPRKVIRCLIGLLYAVEHTHNLSVLHRDIKPANILMSRGRAKLSDYGVAGILQSGCVGSNQGTPLYQAPELTSTNPSATRQSDIFSMGMTLFILLNAHWNIEGVQQSDVVNGNVVNKLGWKRHFPKKIKSIVSKACHKEISKRYCTASEMNQALQRIKISIDWIQKEDHWIGENINGDMFKVEIRTRRDKKVEKIVKKNNRKINREHEVFEGKYDAQRACEKFVSETFLE